MTMSNPEKMLIEYFKEKAEATVNSQTLLLEEKIIDSMGVVELIAFIEGEFGLELTDDDLTVEDFQTIETITALILKRDRERV
jgi:acyl carrier protein